MQFNLPYNWLRDYIDVPKDAREFAKELSLYGATVEKVHKLSYDFSEVYVGEILEIVKHPNADKLQIATVFLGKSKRVVVCGAPNIAVGQRVPVAIPGATLPGDFHIEKREVRGVVSDGMLCSAKELGLGADHSGIMILSSDAPVGKKLIDLGVAKDELLEIEPTSNRPDVASVLGVAREASAITGKAIKLPKLAKLPPVGQKNLKVKVMDTKRCLRFSALKIDNVQVQPSPWWLQERLIRAGIRPINNIVDITNYVMLETGQPMHAFDADVVKSELVIRSATKGEKFFALDGKSYFLQSHHLVIADANNEVVSLPGIMGGESSGVTTKTQNIILEVASWDKVMIRKTARDLQITSEAAKLFEKGLSVEATLFALQRAVALVFDIAGGQVSSSLVDKQSRKYKSRIIDFNPQELVRHLGVSIPTDKVIGLLKNLGFSIKESKKHLLITVPYWREHDVNESIDIVEEVARLYGYHRFESILPEATFKRSDGAFTSEDNLKQKLQSLGFTEVYSYSLVSEKHVKATDLDFSKVIAVANPLSSDLQYLRPSILPSLVEIVEHNQGNFDKFRVFEMAMMYDRGGKGRGVDGFRSEHHALAGVVVDPNYDVLSLFRLGKGLVSEFVGAEAKWVPLESSAMFSVNASAELVVGDMVVGQAGLLNKKITAMFGVTKEVFAFELSVNSLLKISHRFGLVAVPKYPVAKRDISLVVDRGVRYNELADIITQSSSLLSSFELFDIYSGSMIGADKLSYSFHLSFSHPEKTLSNDEVDTELDKIVTALNKKNIKLR